MLLEIRSVGDPVLRQAARQLSRKEILSFDTQQLIANMRDTMRKAPGVGLAAPQVGIGVQLAVIEDRPEYAKDIAPEILAERERPPVPFQVVINPVLTLDAADVEFFEGCLSLPGLTGLVVRARKVRVECLNEHAKPRVIEASGWFARILQHEIDHLNGTLYIDRVDTRSLSTLDNFTKHWQGVPVADMKHKLEAG